MFDVDGTYLACGGREKTLRLIYFSDFKEKSAPIRVGGRVWDIQFMPSGSGEIGLAIGTGDYLATIFDITGETPTPTILITRPRTVRCCKFGLEQVDCNCRSQALYILILYHYLPLFQLKYAIIQFSRYLLSAMAQTM